MNGSRKKLALIFSMSDEPILYPLYEIDGCIKQRPEYAGQVRPLRAGELLRLE